MDTVRTMLSYIDESYDFYAENHSRTQSRACEDVCTLVLSRYLHSHHPVEEVLHGMRQNVANQRLQRKAGNEEWASQSMSRMRQREAETELRQGEAACLLRTIQASCSANGKSEGLGKETRGHSVLLGPNHGLRLLRHSRIAISHDRPYRRQRGRAKEETVWRSECEFCRDESLAGPEQFPTGVPGPLLQLQLRQGYEERMPPSNAARPLPEASVLLTAATRASKYLAWTR